MNQFMTYLEAFLKLFTEQKVQDLFLLQFFFFFREAVSLLKLTIPSDNCVFNKFRIVKAVDELHASIYYVAWDWFLDSTVIPFRNSTSDRIVNEIQVSNFKTMINRVFIQESLDYSDGYLR